MCLFCRKENQEKKKSS